MCATHCLGELDPTRSARYPCNASTNPSWPGGPNCGEPLLLPHPIPSLPCKKKWSAVPVAGCHGDIIISVCVPPACSILLTIGIDYVVILRTRTQQTVAKSSQPDTFSFCLCRPLIGRNAFLEQSLTPRSAEQPPHPRPPMRDEIASWISSQRRTGAGSAMLECKTRPQIHDPTFFSQYGSPWRR